MENEKPVGNVEYTLTVARGLISKPENWHQGWFAKAKEDGTGVAYCALGAIIHSEKSLVLRAGAVTLLRGALPQDYSSILTFNDSKEHAEILALYDRAIAKAREQNL